MTSPTTPPAPRALDHVIALKAEFLCSLLEQVRPAPAGTSPGVVISAVRDCLPTLMCNMASGHYQDLGVIPAAYVSATLPAPGWATVLHFLHLASGRYGDEDSHSGTRVRDYNGGARWACNLLKAYVRPLGGDTGEEPLNFKIARHAAELGTHVGQVVRAAAAGGARCSVLSVLFESLPRLVTVMNSALPNHLELLPRILNPGYLPAAGWEAVVQNLQDDIASKVKGSMGQQYYDGARSACVHATDLFGNLTQPAMLLAA